MAANKRLGRLVGIGLPGQNRLGIGQAVTTGKVSGEGLVADGMGDARRASHQDLLQRGIGLGQNSQLLDIVVTAWDDNVWLLRLDQTENCLCPTVPTSKGYLVNRVTAHLIGTVRRSVATYQSQSGASALKGIEHNLADQCAC